MLALITWSGKVMQDITNLVSWNLPCKLQRPVACYWPCWPLWNDADSDRALVSWPLQSEVLFRVLKYWCSPPEKVTNENNAEVYDALDDFQQCNLVHWAGLDVAQLKILQKHCKNPINHNNFEISLELQIPSKKVLWGVFRRSNTFLEGSWIPRVYQNPEKPILVPVLVVLFCYSTGQQLL